MVDQSGTSAGATVFRGVSDLKSWLTLRRFSPMECWVGKCGLGVALHPRPKKNCKEEQRLHNDVELPLEHCRCQTVKSLVAFSFVPSEASTGRSLSPLHSRRDDGRLERMLPCLRRHDRQSCYPRRRLNGRNFVTITPTQGLAIPQERIGRPLRYIQASMAPAPSPLTVGSRPPFRNPPMIMTA